MKPVWIAFFAGIFLGANIGIAALALLMLNRPCDHYLPDIEDVEARPPRLSNQSRDGGQGPG